MFASITANLDDAQREQFLEDLNDSDDWEVQARRLASRGWLGEVNTHA